VDTTFDSALDVLTSRGAVLVEVGLPEPLDNLWPLMGPVVDADFGPQIKAYLDDLPEGAPRKLEDLIAQAEEPSISNSATPLNPARLQGFRDAAASGGYESEARRRSLEALIPDVRKKVLAIMDEEQLDALIFPTMSCPASPCHDREDATYVCNSEDPYKPCYLASTTGFPEITVPAGVTSNLLPVGISFFGRPFTEERLIGLSYDFEQASHARRAPVHTPSLNAEGL
jgi:amidase